MNKSLIFVTTGTQFPFDRLISQVNEWAASENNIKIIAQTANSTKKYEHLSTVDFLSPSQYDEYTSEAQVIIGHAGMGTIITGFEKNKPLVLMARKFQFGEHRNDHQQSTIDKFNGVKGIYIANNELELKDLLSRYKELESASNNDNPNRDKLIKFLSHVIKEC